MDLWRLHTRLRPPSSAVLHLEGFIVIRGIFVSGVNHILIYWVALVLANIVVYWHSQISGMCSVTDVSLIPSYPSTSLHFYCQPCVVAQ